MVMSLLIIRYENKVSRKHISALIKPRWTSESEMEWLLMAPIFAKLPFCGLLLQGRDCPRLSHFRSCKLPKRDQYKLTYKAQQDGGEAVRLFLVPTDRPTFYFKASHCQPAAHLWFFFFSPAHWFTLHTQHLAPCNWFVFLSRLQLPPNRYKCASVAGKWRAWEVPDWITLMVPSPAANAQRSIEGGGTRSSAGGEGLFLQTPPCLVGMVLLEYLQEETASQTLHLISHMNFIKLFWICLYFWLLWIPVPMLLLPFITFFFFFLCSGAKHIRQQYNKWVWSFSFAFYLLTVSLPLILELWQKTRQLWALCTGTTQQANFLQIQTLFPVFSP